MISPRLKRRVLTGLLLAGLGCGPLQGDDTFGRRENTGDGALIGIFYDLKQSQQRKPTGVTPTDYTRVLSDFIAKGWDEAVFAPYFRTTRALYTTQVFVPMMSAGEAPKAFDLQGVVKPSEWVAHYKGQVSAPSDGAFRFIGYADDIIAVAVNGKTVLVGSRFPVPSWTLPASGMRAANGLLTCGPWVELKRDQVVDLDVLIGERPGGDFCAFLLYEKRGEKYPVTEKNEPMLPVFQLVRRAVPDFPRNLAPPVSVPATPWKGLP